VTGHNNLKRFTLRRHVDESGVSGIGVVAEGIEFTDGTCVVRWIDRGNGMPPTTAMHSNIESVRAIHGHHGLTQIEWID